MTTTILNVPAISCEHCQRAVTNALTPVQGVRSVNVDVPTKKVTVEYDEKVVGVDRLKDVLAEEDYPVASVG
ncbi:MAG: heavy-metal-associated domain-containing protein [Chloroflexi bacterium]|nr:heavy-metal-associated domain-containing protein [Chloroflexota bacterium]